MNNAALKTVQKVIISIVPRNRRSPCAYSKNLSINSAPRDLYLREGATFVDPYDRFFGKLELFKRKVHFNEGRKSELARVVEEGF